MKVKRYKKIRKILHSYELSHHIRAPFKVAVDGEFLQSALCGQIMLREQLPKMLQEERTSVFVTPCIDNWLRLKGPQYSGALHIASKLAHLKCRHEKGFVRPFDCIKHLVADGNPDHLLIGAQDEPIRKLIRHCAGVPLLFIHGSTVIMEAPTQTTKEAHAEAITKLTARMEKDEAKKVKQAALEMKQEENAAAGVKVKRPMAQASSKKKKRKGPAQPNSLSVKKKKPAAATPAASTSTKKSVDSSAAEEQPKKKQKTTNETQPAAAAASSSSSSAPSVAAPSTSEQPAAKKQKVASSSSSAAASSAPSPAQLVPASAANTNASSSSSTAAASTPATQNKKKRARSYKKKDEGEASSKKTADEE